MNASVDSHERNQPLTLDAVDATELLESGVNRAHLSELEERVRAIQESFAAEQQKGYAVLERNLRAWTQSHLRSDEIDATIALAERIRDRFAAFVLVGIGGSDLGGRTLHDSLDHPFHNQVAPEQRGCRPDGTGGAPEIYFTGDTFDPKRLIGILDLLEARGLLDKTCVDVVSKSGKTGETIAAAMVFRERMEKAGLKDWTQRFVATTGQNDQSVLFKMNQSAPFFGMLPVPEGVGGRFSFASPVGLLPFAVTAVDKSPSERVKIALAGYAEAHRRFLLPSNDEDNTACQLARWWHLAEQFCHKTDLVFFNYSDDARLGDWFVQLYEESVQERGGGLNVLCSRGPTGNHSIFNGILRGKHDKLVMLIRWKGLGANIAIPTGTGVGGDMTSFEGLTLSDVQDASCQAMPKLYIDEGVPAATVTVSDRDTYHVFLAMRTFMDAVAVKGRLQYLHITANGIPDESTDLTYRQDGVEAFKEATRRKAAEMQSKLLSARIGSEGEMKP